MSSQRVNANSKESRIHPSFQLRPHPTARSQAIVTESIPAGTVVLITHPLSTVLLPSEKEKRCDTCLRPSSSLKRCTGCRSYFYCDKSCQLRAWNAHHRRICKDFLSYTDSAPYKALTADEKLHALLLTHLIAEHEASLTEAYSRRNQESSPDGYSLDQIESLLSLLPKAADESSLAACSIPLPRTNANLALYLSRRFANNNFTIHCSRLNTFAHGVFPLASRFFNHSCFPSAVAVYTSTGDHEGIEMHVKLIRDLNPDDEVTIPYVDPALPYSERQHVLQNVYGFRCSCVLCCAPYSDHSRKETPPHLLNELRERIFTSICNNPAILRSPEFASLRETLWNAANQLLPILAKDFSDASHSSRHKQAIEAGSALLAVYSILYPSNYLLTGLHALEVAKVYWNAYVTDNLEKDVFSSFPKVFRLAKQVIEFFRKGTTGTDLCHGASPSDEVQTLESAIRSEGF